MNLVDSIIQFAASDKLDGDAWNTLVTASNLYAVGELPDVLRNSEKEFKERTGLTSMPSRWRSAKSVLLKARNHHVPLLDDNGQVIGKSAIEKYCKAKKEDKEIDPFEACDVFIGALREVLDNHHDKRAELQAHIITGVTALC